MLIFDIISIVLLSILLFWSVYNGSIIFAGYKTKRKISSTNVKKDEWPNFSIIVPTKNEEAVIGRCLTALMNLDYPKDKMDIIVVDGNSSDSTGKICMEFSKEHPQNIKFIVEKESRGSLLH